MQLCSVEHKLNTSLTFFSSKLDSHSPMFWLEKNLILSNVLITGESNFDEKNVKEVFNMCSIEQSCIHIGITCYKISFECKISALYVPKGHSYDFDLA